MERKLLFSPGNVFPLRNEGDQPEIHRSSVLTVRCAAWMAVIGHSRAGTSREGGEGAAPAARSHRITDCHHLLTLDAVSPGVTHPALIQKELYHIRYFF